MESFQKTVTERWIENTGFFPQGKDGKTRKKMQKCGGKFGPLGGVDKGDTSHDAADRKVVEKKKF